MNKIAIVTSLYGTIDQLKTPKHVFKNADYYAFVSQDWSVKVWKQIKAYNFTIDNHYTGRRNAKIYKILPELFIPGYDYYIYHDPSYGVIQDPQKIIGTYMKDNDIAVFKHNQRDCIYDEAEKLIEWKYDITENIEQWTEQIFFEQYPKNNGLYELPCFIKKNTKQMTEMSLMWWEIICKYSSRDQLSLPYVLWKKNIQPAILPGYANGRNGDGSLGCNNICPQLWEKKR